MIQTVFSRGREWNAILSMCNLKGRGPLISDSRSVTVRRQSAGLSATVFLTLTLLFTFTNGCFLFPNPCETLIRRASQDCSSILGLNIAGHNIIRMRILRQKGLTVHRFSWDLEHQFNALYKIFSQVV